MNTLKGERRRVRDLVERARQRVDQRARDELHASLQRTQVSAPREVPPVAPRPALAPEPPRALGKPTPLRLRSPSGRTEVVTLAPAVATREDLAAVQSTGARNARRAFEALRGHDHTLRELEASQRELTRKVAALEERGDLALLGLLQSFAGLEQRVASTAVAQREVVAQERKALQALVTRQRKAARSRLRVQARAEQVQKLNGVVSSMQVAAFGQKGSQFATNNLLLAGNQLLWTFIEPLLRGLGVTGAGASTLGLLAPLGSLVTGNALLGNRQHERFVSGVVIVTAGRRTAFMSLRGRIASAAWQKFRARTDVPVTATPLDPSVSVMFVAVRQGTLFVVVDDEGAPKVDVRIAWMVDTGEG